jgi:hypothetical protein
LQQQPAHILLRVRASQGRTITAHAAMVATEGSAMLAKMGKAVSAAFQSPLYARGRLECIDTAVEKG